MANRTTEAQLFQWQIYQQTTEIWPAETAICYIVCEGMSE